MSFIKSNIGVALVIALHAFGIVGTLISSTSTITLTMTPINLEISSLIVYAYSSLDKSVLHFFIISYLIGLTVEILGVQTGFPFGDYQYGSVLGPKILGVPFMIGINWFMLSYAIGILTNRFNRLSMFGRAAVGASLMVMLDIFIEPVAIKLDYWQWDDISIPLSNYLSWWLISFILQVLFQRNLKAEKNIIAIPLIISQMTYFVSIIFFY